ncbi:farnesyl-diphosphate synthase [Caloramator quimbayensis]|uniref:Farnesyl diphosphate synthase n=1 Tax=Caloramator quimbayensis TaxID=1147123 RepID=A0A1T4WXC1_9CLOT|nr:farnesyl diphosphate synthase [Caloramator quimbayensis]SKA82012.1 farnesyl-diphosphate synthase [Caloramator quimbayensis]
MDFQKELMLKQELINRRLEKIINEDDAPKKIVEAMKYSLLAGGKRIRPVLAVSICEALGGKIEDILDFACSIELIHTYSLIHDDLPAMDNDDLRRGKPTNHVVFGEATAILAGDALLNYAFEIILKEALDKNKYCYLKAADIIAKSAGIKGMIGGQVIDLESEGLNISIEALYNMHRKKTGALIEASCLCGCIIAQKEDMTDTVKEYGKNLGIAFQIVDDILDYEGDPKKLGKNTGIDKKNNKSTFVSILGIDESKKLAQEYSKNAKNNAKIIDKSGFLLSLTDYLLNRES